MTINNNAQGAILAATALAGGIIIGWAVSSTRAEAAAPALSVCEHLVTLHKTVSQLHKNVRWVGDQAVLNRTRLDNARAALEVNNKLARGLEVTAEDEAALDASAAEVEEMMSRLDAEGHWPDDTDA